MRNVWPTGAAAIRPGRRRPARIRSAQVPACALVDPRSLRGDPIARRRRLQAPALIGGIEAIEPSRSWSRNLRAAGTSAVRRRDARRPAVLITGSSSTTAARVSPRRDAPRKEHPPLCFAATRPSRGRKRSRWVSIWVERNATDRPHGVRGCSPGGTPLSSSGTPAGSVPGPFLMRAGDYVLDVLCGAW